MEAQLSLKLTSMGLDISDDVVLKNMRKIMEAAGQYGVFITIDMEDFSTLARKRLIFLRSLNQNTIILVLLFKPICIGPLVILKI